MADPEALTALRQQVKAKFSLVRITQDWTRYDYAVAHLNARYTSEVRDILSNPPTANLYEHLKTELIRRLSLTEEQKNGNAALKQFCLERGFTFLDGLVDNWPGCLSRDGVHPRRFGNKVLAGFLHREAYVLSIHLERRRIQQSYRESKASAWNGWTQQESVPTISEADFPPLEKASAEEAAVPQAVCQHGDSEWKLVQSKKRRRKAAALRKQEQSCELCADNSASQFVTARVICITGTRKKIWVHAYRQNLPTFGNNTKNRIECHNQKIKNYVASSMNVVQAAEALVGYIDKDALSRKFSKLNEVKLNQNVNDLNDPFQLDLSRNCTSEATSKVLEQYDKFKNVRYQVTSTANSYVVVSPISEYSVSICLTSCTCALYYQYALPCAHILAVRNFTKQDLFDKACIPYRWRKDNSISDSYTTTTATPLVTSSIQPPPSVKLDTAQEKYSYAYRRFIEF
ncbi:uncharacterized protein LOC125759511 [Rhipicephalus sanguineus]|uniref:uncharacterized protein LOC125759511 n=1 Tax=Rhipicephalus sanguineus TaxID=34632 RepID=UPI0020C45AFD|nr:uncharacterized protein LOC125759511 [Rhipicephalus sanguineus]